MYFSYNLFDVILVSLLKTVKMQQRTWDAMWQEPL